LHSNEVTSTDTNCQVLTLTKTRELVQSSTDTDTNYQALTLTMR